MWKWFTFRLFIQSFCSTDKISNLNQRPSPLETVELRQELLHWQGSIFLIYVVSQHVKSLTDTLKQSECICGADK